MQSLTTSLQKFGKALNDALPGLVHHYYRPAKKFPYVVWTEVAEGPALYSDNRKVEQSISVDVEYYTQEEYDPNIDTIQGVLDTIADAWNVDAVQFEEETELIHYSFSAEVRVEYGEN